MREIKQIIIHCSDSSFGDVGQVRSWHLEKGFSDVGYHYIIMNGIYHLKDVFDVKLDGKIQVGRSIHLEGAHCQGDNKDSVGICLIGIDKFTIRQFDSLLALIERLKDRFGNIPIYGHYEMRSGISQRKTCPNFDVDKFRKDHKLYA